MYAAILRYDQVTRRGDHLGHNNSGGKEEEDRAAAREGNMDRRGNIIGYRGFSGSISIVT